MGGAIATRAAASGNIRSLLGLVVIDVVEGKIPQIALDPIVSFASIIIFVFVSHWF